MTTYFDMYKLHSCIEDLLALKGISDSHPSATLSEMHHEGDTVGTRVRQEPSLCVDLRACVTSNVTCLS